MKNVNEEDQYTFEEESRSFNTPTRSVRINSNQNSDQCTSRNTNHKASVLNLFSG